MWEGVGGSMQGEKGGSLEGKVGFLRREPGCCQGCRSEREVQGASPLTLFSTESLAKLPSPADGPKPSRAAAGSAGCDKVPQIQPVRVKEMPAR